MYIFNFIVKYDFYTFLGLTSSKSTSIRIMLFFLLPVALVIKKIIAAQLYSILVKQPIHYYDTFDELRQDQHIILYSLFPNRTKYRMNISGAEDLSHRIVQLNERKKEDFYDIFDGKAV